MKELGTMHDFEGRLGCTPSEPERHALALGQTGPSLQLVEALTLSQVVDPT